MKKYIDKSKLQENKDEIITVGHLGVGGGRRGLLFLPMGLQVAFRLQVIKTH